MSEEATYTAAPGVRALQAGTSLWIEVADQNPPVDTWVLVWTGEYMFMAMRDSRYGSHWVPVYESEYWTTPTHWQPLPQPPTGPEGAG